MRGWSWAWSTARPAGRPGNAFAYRGGKYRILDEGGPNFAGANAVNDSDQVAGAMEVKENE